MGGGHGPGPPKSGACQLVGNQLPGLRPTGRRAGSLGGVVNCWWVVLAPGCSGRTIAGSLVGAAGPRISGCRALGVLELVLAY